MASIVTAATNSQRAALGAGVIPRGHVRLTCGDPAMRLVALLGSEAPRLTAGVGGWSVLGRPQGVGATLWEGSEPFALSLPLMLDGWSARRSQEAALKALQRVAHGDGESPPGVVRVEGIPLPVHRWVIEGIDYGDPILALDGKRLRQPLTLTLREHAPPRLRRPRRATVRVVRARKGDTPAKIAKRHAMAWTKVRSLNRSLNLKANTKLKAGTKIRIPARDVHGDPVYEGD